MNSSYSRNFYTFVNGLDGAKNYPIMPNQSIMLMDIDNPVCYMKSADMSGKPSLKCYKLVEIEENELIKVPVNPQAEEIKSEIVNMNRRIDDLYELIKGEKKDA